MKLEIPVKVDFDDVQVMIDELKKIQTYKLFEEDDTVFVILDDVISILTKHIRATHNSSEFPNGWIPCSERLPCDGIPVNITWVNRKPVSYYVDIKDKHFTSTGIYYRGKWFWYSWACEDLLYEYGNSKADAVDEDVEIIAWMPLPEPWKGGKNEII